MWGKTTCPGEEMIRENIEKLDYSYHMECLYIGKFQVLGAQVIRLEVSSTGSDPTKTTDGGKFLFLGPHFCWVLEVKLETFFEFGTK